MDIARFRKPMWTFILLAVPLMVGGVFSLGRAQQPNTAVEASDHGPGVPAFWIRPGYRVTLAAELPDARFLAFNDQGDTLYVSRPRPGDIVALKDNDHDGTFESRTTYVREKPTVHGLCFADGWLYFSQTGAIWRARGAKPDGQASEVQPVIPEGQIPSGGGHWWRPVLVTKDALYTGIGDDGNINDHRNDEREKLYRFRKDGTGKTLFAGGIRNTEKLLLRPGTDEVWGADHGSDWMGAPLGDKRGLQPITDANPPCEFNRYQSGGFYGHPFITGTGMPRLEFKDAADLLDIAAKTIAPEWNLGAHWAPNGFTFLAKDYFGADHQGDAFIACHGSWNSSKPVGYRVERICFDKVTGRPYGSLRIVGTLSADNQVLGRPVDCVEAPDGSVLFSDDMRGRIYRISRLGNRTPAASLPDRSVPGPDGSAPRRVAEAPAATAQPFGPIAFYDSACARCHGPNGSFYGPTLGRRKTDQQLRAVIRQMVEGPSNTSLNAAQLDALTAYHRALIRKEPFVAVTSREGGAIRGEVTPGTTVTVRRKGRQGARAAESPARVEGSRWSVTLPSGTADGPVVVTARRNGAAVTVDTSRRLWSHTEPLSGAR